VRNLLKSYVLLVCSEFNLLLRTFKEYLNLRDMDVYLCVHKVHRGKWKVLQRVVNQFGAYLSHLVALCEDTSEDRVRLKGYLLKWSHAKLLIGGAMFM